ncbi:uncharacterized protein LOC143305809 [Osmia lignaria lignaria]|uniref:uncharacterized protein LOC114875094 n=1 Tax=Osmia bicornis bicornis TaxID=1437191 RepID=UPI0010F92E2F|nr:uncharacterized protein LOC114875094 [Osmia bicornis bicornis]
MFRYILRTLSCETSSSKYLKRKYSDSNKNNVSNNDIAFEAEYYYKQDKELLDMLKQKLQEEVKCMQDEVITMRDKIEEHNRNIDENLRFLKDLEKNVSASDKK